MVSEWQINWATSQLNWDKSNASFLHQTSRIHESRYYFWQMRLQKYLLQTAMTLYSDECSRYSSTSDDWKAFCSIEKDTFQACHFNDKALSKSEPKTRIDERNRYLNFKFLAFR